MLKSIFLAQKIYITYTTLRLRLITVQKPNWTSKNGPDQYQTDTKHQNKYWTEMCSVQFVPVHNSSPTKHIDQLCIRPNQTRPNRRNMRKEMGQVSGQNMFGPVWQSWFASSVQFMVHCAHPKLRQRCTNLVKTEAHLFSLCSGLLKIFTRFRVKIVNCQFSYHAPALWQDQVLLLQG